VREQPEGKMVINVRKIFSFAETSNIYYVLYVVPDETSIIRKIQIQEKFSFAIS